MELDIEEARTLVNAITIPHYTVPPWFLPLIILNHRHVTMASQGSGSRLQ
jgi:hypothetical protein